MRRGGVDYLYYITHVDNVPSILTRGILCHDRVEKEQIQYTRIYDEQIVANGGKKQTPDGRSLWSFANFYFQPRNAMLFRVKCERGTDKVAILAVRPDILNESDLFISTGNAASFASRIQPRDEGLRSILQMRDILNKEWWSRVDDSKRKMMAECLIPDMVPSEFIQAIYVADHAVAEQVRPMIRSFSIKVIPDPKMFFKPHWESWLTKYLSLAEGDMFFSGMHTLTISVNTRGVMGRGLASTTKYRFPDAYVKYQDLCRERKLRMGKPRIYKRSISSDYELADEPSTLKNANSETWFLFFPTKNHWRERASIQGIEEGLRWLQENYKKEGIESLAVPSLGCGLGWLDWHDVGPLLCRYLSTLDIRVQLYLPAERKVPDELLTKEFLLGQGS